MGNATLICFLSDFQATRLQLRTMLQWRQRITRKKYPGGKRPFLRKYANTYLMA